MYGGRITSEERSAISTYIGVGIAIVLIAGGLYVFFLTQKEKRETTGFDPNRPVPSDAVLKRRLKAEEYFVVRQGGTQTPFQNEFWNNKRTEVRAKRSNAHLGHLFPDPKSPTGQSYSVNSAAFHFIPIEQMKDRGYEAFLSRLEKK